MAEPSVQCPGCGARRQDPLAAHPAANASVYHCPFCGVAFQQVADGSSVQVLDTGGRRGL